MVNRLSSSDSDHSDIRKEIVHLGRRLRYKNELTSLPQKEFPPVQDAMKIATRLKRVYPVRLHFVEKLHDLLRREILSHIGTHFLREMGVPAQRITPTHEAGNLNIRVA
jgi:hypothetical protein